MAHSEAFEDAWDQVKAAVGAVPIEHRIKIIEAAVRKHKETLRERCWIEDDEDGFTGWRWDKYNKTRYIVCAANRYKDYIVTGSRHYCVSMNAQIDLIGMDALRAYAADDYEQGFIDQYGVFWSRSDALEHVKKTGQLRYPEHCTRDELFSEGLY
ncbi:hypothetical protein RVBP21_1130 [Pseudomonas phage BRkr]|nr:hypothetical protein RVBP21_1130 [Pseudomonas phage BRkr]